MSAKYCGSAPPDFSIANADGASRAGAFTGSLTHQRGNPRSHFQISLRLIALVCCLSLGAQVRGGNESQTVLPSVEEVRLPFERVKPDMLREMVPVPLEKYRELVQAMESIRTSPAPIKLLSARYTVVFAGHRLRTGRFSWQFENRSQKPRTWVAEPFGVSATNLKWGEEAAAWGSSASGQTEILIDRSAGSLSGDWELSGRSLGNLDEFQLPLPPAAASTLDLKTQPGFTVEVGGKPALLTGTDNGWDVWNISWNKSPPERIVIRSPDPSERPVSPVVLVRNDAIYNIRQEGLRFRTDLHLDVTQSSIREIPLHVDSDLEVYSITYGNDLPVNWERSETEGRQKVVIKLSDQLRGAGRMLRVRAVAPLRTDADWKLPNISVMGATLVDGQATLQLTHPVVMRNVSPSGYHQIGVESTSARNDLLTFRQFRTDGILNVRLGKPIARWSAQVWSDIRTQGTEWTSRTRMELSGIEGATFRIDARVPNGWEIIDVRDPSGAKVDWSAESAALGQQILSLQLLEGLGTEQPRVIEIDSRKSAGNTDQTQEIPAFEPLGCDDLRMLVVVAASSDVRPVLEPGTTFDPCEISDLEESCLKSSFWKSPLAERSPVPLMLRLNGQSAEGNFALQSLQTPIAVEVKSQISLRAERISKETRIKVTPKHGRIERLLVYDSEPGPTPTWLLAGKTPIETRKLSTFRHGAWDLPMHGELWELRLPNPQQGPFELQLSQTRGLVPAGRFGLVFLPQAQSFLGEVVVDASAALSLEMEAKDVESEVTISSTPGLTTRSWSWKEATATLAFQTHFDASDTLSPVIRRVRIQARCPLLATGSDLFQVQLALGPGFRDRALRCTLPANVKVLDVNVDGQSIPFEAPTAQGDLRLTNLTDESEVAIVYRLASRSAAGPIWFTVPFPKFEVPVLRCEFELFLPESHIPGGDSYGMALKHPQASISVLQRLFGPLGSGPQDVIFRPWSASDWAGLFVNSASNLEPSAISSDRSREPANAIDIDNGAKGVRITEKTQQRELGDRFEILELGRLTSGTRPGWRLYRSSSALMPERVAMWLWPGRQVQGTMWLMLFATLLTGIALRVTRMPYRSMLGGIVMTFAILLAFTLPSVPARIAGAGLAGTVFATLWPRRWLGRRDISQMAQVPQGSTQKYRSEGSDVALKLILIVPFISVFSAPLAAQPLPVAGIARTITAPQTSTVLIPVDSKGAPWGTQPMAYVPERLLKEWLNQTRVRDASAPWLITTANYRLWRNSSHQVSLTVGFDIVVLSEEDEVDVEIPLAGLNLAGETACKVDGHAYPILTRPDSSNLFLRLRGADVKPVAPPMPESLDEHNRVTWSAPRRTYQVELTGYPIFRSLGDRTWFESQIPRLNSSRIRIENQSSQDTWKLQFADTIHTLAPNQQEEWELGPIQSLRIEDVVPSQEVVPALSLNARLSLLADARPAVLDLNYQATYQVAAGQVSQVQWLFPNGTAVREVSGPDVLEWRLGANANEQTRLTISLRAPVSESFTINVKAVMPNTGPPSQVVLQPVMLLGPNTESLQPSTYLIGVRTQPEFQVEAPAETGEQIAAATVEEFLADWGVVDSRPQLVFKMLDPVPLKVELRSLASQRVVRLHATGILGSRRLQWSLNGTIEVQSAAAYSHQLEIDPRLNVTQVTIQEDSANRLLRWTREGNILHVFLRDKTTGTQILSVQGTIPTQVPQELVLPWIRFLDATVADARIQLYQEPDLEVELLDLEKWERIESPPELRVGTARNLLLGRFKWPLGGKALAVRAVQNEPVMDYTAVTSLHPRDGHWKLNSTLFFDVRKGHGSQFAIDVPPELPLVRVDAADVRQLFEQNAEGGQRIVLIPQTPVRGRFVVHLSSELTWPTGVPSVIPRIRGLNATLKEHLVMLPAEELLNVDPRNSRLEIISGIPSELAKLLPTEIQGRVTRTYRGLDGEWIVSAPRPQEEMKRTGVLWTESQVWFGPVNTISGRTQIILGSHDTEYVDLAVPIGVDALSVLLDGEFLPLSSPREGILRIPLVLPQSGHRITVYWSQPTRDFSEWWDRTEIFWPRLQGIASSEQFLSMTPPPGQRLRTNGGIPVDRNSVQLEELVVVLQLLQQRTQDGVAPQDAHWISLCRQADRLIRGLENNTATNSGAKSQREKLIKMKEQFAPWRKTLIGDNYRDQDLTDQLNALRGSNQPDGSLAGPHSLLIRLPGSAGNKMTLVLIHEAIWTWGTGLSIGSLVLTLLTLAGRWRFADRVSDSSVIWFVLGTIWWLCLTPSWVGMVWYLYGIGSWWRDRTRSLHLPSSRDVKTPEGVDE